MGARTVRSIQGTNASHGEINALLSVEMDLSKQTAPVSGHPMCTRRISMAQNTVELKNATWER